MGIIPVKEEEAKGKVKECYERLKEAFQEERLPVFFTYLGPFPEYLAYITGQIADNFSAPSFRQLVNDFESQAVEEIKKFFTKSPRAAHWWSLYHHTPGFYSFQKNLKKISQANAKLAFIFLALREAVKGWAVAAKKLPAKTFSREEKEDFSPEDFLFEKISEEEQILKIKQESSHLFSAKNTLEKTSTALEKNPLPFYLELCRQSFEEEMKKENFLFLRVEMEKRLLSLLSSLPRLVFSPFNLIVSLTKKYENFPELLYLLAESFPTLAMQRLIFSLYLQV